MAQQINLFDPALQKKRDWLALGNVTAAAVLLVTLVTVVGVAVRTDVPALAAQVATQDAQLKALRDQVTALGQQIAGRKPDARLEQELSTAKLLLEGRGEVLGILRQRLGPEAVSYADYLRGFARQTLPGLWLTGFAFNPTSSGMEIEGRVSDPALLPEYIRRLNREPAFKGRAFAALQLAEGKAEPAPGTVPSGAVPAPVAPKQAAFHEFKLTPVKPAGSSEAGKPAVLTQLPPAAASGGSG